MNKLSLVAAFGLLAATCFAQNETKSFSGSFKGAGTVSVTPQGVATQKSTQQGAISHTFSITPAQEAALNSGDVQIQIGGFEISSDFHLGDDPKFAPGSKSVKVKQIISESGFEGTADISAKWGKGQMTVAMKVKGVGNTIVSTKLNKAATVKAPGHPAATMPFGINVSSSEPISITGYSSYSMKQSQSVSVSSDGAQAISMSAQAKSDQLVDAPDVIIW